MVLQRSFLQGLLCLLSLLACARRAAGEALNLDSTVFVIVMENHYWSEIKDSPDAPFINNALLPTASYAEGYRTHPGLRPSEPNYLCLEAGTNFGITNNNPPAINHLSTADHLVAQLRRAGVSWRTYQEDLPVATPITEDAYPYAVRHNPFVFFDDVMDDHGGAAVRPFTELACDLVNDKVARYNFITPNVINDMHDWAPPLYNPVRQGDGWLAEVVPSILRSASYRRGGVLIITWDEGSYTASEGAIGMIVLSPLAKGGGYHNSVRYSHSSTVRTMQKIFGVGPLLAGAGTATDLSDLFVENAVPNADSPIRMQGVNWTAGGFKLEWWGQPGLTYQVQWSDRPDGDVWKTLTPGQTGAGERLTFLDDGTQTGGFTAPERFYRVMVP